MQPSAPRDLCLPDRSTTRGRVKILQVLAEDTLGGSELHAVIVARRLRRDAGHQTAIVTLTGPGEIDRLARADGTPCRALPARTWPLRVARLASLLRRERFDVVEAYGANASSTARLANVLAGRPSAMVVGVQGLLLTETLDAAAFKERLARAIERGTHRAVDAYDVNSSEAVDTVVGCGVAASRVHYIPNGVDTEYWAPGGPPIADRAAIVVCAARLVARKRQGDLVEAFHASGLAGRGARLFLVGDGPERARLERQVRDADLQEAVVMCGVLAHGELRDLYQRGVVAVLPSSWEGMPASLLEAQACGLPVIGSNVNGTRDVVEDGRTGLLFDLGDVGALGDALSLVTEDRASAATMGLAARRAVIENYSLDGLLRSKTALYEAVWSGGTAMGQATGRPSAERDGAAAPPGRRG